MMQGADLVLLHGKIWTGEPAAAPATRSGPAKLAQALAIDRGRFVDVGSDAQMQAWIGPDSTVIDLGGRLVVPGMIDAHTHFTIGGLQLLSVDLKDTRSEQEFIRRIGEKAKALAPGRWLRGGGWDEQAWTSGQLPSRGMIDRVTGGHPALLTRQDGHASLANSLALELAGVTRDTLDPAGGTIGRDAAGEPTGILKDAAQDVVSRIIPPPSDAQLAEALHVALAEAARVGLTSVHSITLDTGSWSGDFEREFALWRLARAEGWLTCRVNAIIPIAQWESFRDPQFAGDDFIRLGAVKAFADGSLGSATAWMDEPYTDDFTRCGIPLLDLDANMQTLATLVNQSHTPICIHAIGDRANAEVLDLYERIGGENPAAHRFRIEHAQHLRPQDFARFGKLGIIASMQPYHAVDDGCWAEKRIGFQRARWSYAWRSMLDAGARVAFGSDWPVAPLSPLLGIHAAVTRATLDGKHPGGWIPEERITAEEALHAYTVGAAYAAFQENAKGSIAPGKMGDVAVLSADLLTIHPAKIQDVRVVMTIVGGKIVYQGD